MRRYRPSVATLAAALLVCPAAGFAQAPARVVGRVVDAATQSPVASADVILGEQRTTSRADGGFVSEAYPRAAPGSRYGGSAMLHGASDSTWCQGSIAD